MKKIIVSIAVALAFANCAHAGVIAGPITNPANGHDYYLLTSDTWSASEAEAERLGGTLAVVKDAGEQEWIFSTFGKYGDTNRNLWIGLHRVPPNRSLVWVTGEKLGYAIWAGGQPDDAGGVEGCVFMASADRPWGFPVGSWADCADGARIGQFYPNGVVEVPGKANEKELSGKEKELIGPWYLAGHADAACHIAATENQLFVINEHNFAGRVVFTPDGFLFVAPWRMRGEIIQDRILWSNGTWWSRKANRGDAFELEGLDRSAGPRVDFPIYGGFRGGSQ